MNAIPQFLTNFRMYNSGNVLLGVTGDLTLPKLEAITETISGAGILGEFESAVPGAYKSMTLEVPFRCIDQTMFNMAAGMSNASLTFRGDQQINDFSGNGLVHQGVRMETRGPIKGVDLGKASPGKTTDSKCSQEILFLALYLNNVEVLCLDKLNYIFRINEIDQLQGILANL
jgi:hypothetical protein